MMSINWAVNRWKRYCDFVQLYDLGILYKYEQLPKETNAYKGNLHLCVKFKIILNYDKF